MMYKLPCIKCKQIYETEDEDAYYCPPCLAAKNKLAEEINAKVAAKIASGKSRVQVSELQRYDALKRQGGFPNARDFIGF